MKLVRHGQTRWPLWLAPGAVCLLLRAAWPDLWAAPGITALRDAAVTAAPWLCAAAAALLAGASAARHGRRTLLWAAAAGLGAVLLQLCAHFLCAALAPRLPEWGHAGMLLFGLIDRALLPLGMTGEWERFFLHSLGAYEAPSGVLLIGDLPRFLALDPTAGRFMPGMYAAALFVCPGAAAAVALRAPRPLRRAYALGLGSLSLCSVLTGVSWPLEIALLLLCPPAFILTGVLTGLSCLLCSLLGASAGYAFAPGAVDLVRYWSYGLKAWPVLALGPVLGAASLGVCAAVVRRGSRRGRGASRPGIRTHAQEAACESVHTD